MKIIAKFILIILSSTVTACAPAMYDISFKGKVIDQDTHQPIEGAVALAIWTTWLLGAGGEITNYYDAYEVVTDANGNFYIPGKGPRVACNLNPMTVNIFKAGYLSSGGTHKYYSLNKNSQDGRLLIPLKKLTLEQRKRMRGPGDPPDEAPLMKVRNYLIELDRDRVEQGFSPRGVWNGEIYATKQLTSH